MPRNWLITLFIGGLVAFYSFVVLDIIESSDNAGVVAGVAQLPLALFLLTCGVLAFGTSPLRRPLWGLWIALVLIALGLDKLGWQVVWGISVVLAVYYRILPDYAIQLLEQLPSTLPWVNRVFPSRPLSQSHHLPPHSSEILWFPLPGHAQLLTQAFRQNPQAALPTFQQMQAASLPGCERTLRQALPQIVADQLAAVHTIADLKRTASPEHPILPLLVPAFYQSEPKIEPSATVLPEIATVLPKLQDVAEDVGKALEASNAPLRARALESIHTQLTTLQTQLPGCG